MSQSILKRAALVAAMGVGSAGMFYAGYAYAAVDPKLGQADASVDQAIALLKAAKNQGVRPPFGGHRWKAVRHLQRAKREIALSTKWAENPPDRSKRKKRPPRKPRKR